MAAVLVLRQLIGRDAFVASPLKADGNNNKVRWPTITMSDSLMIPQLVFAAIAVLIMQQPP